MNVVSGWFSWLARLFKRNQQRAPAPFDLGAFPIWTVDDALQLRKFLTTGTGARLVNRFAHQSHVQSLAGCSDPMHTAHSAGVAHGFNEAKEWFFSLSRVTGAQVTNDEHPPQGEPDLLEQLSP